MSCSEVGICSWDYLGGNRPHWRCIGYHGSNPPKHHIQLREVARNCSEDDIVVGCIDVEVVETWVYCDNLVEGDLVVSGVLGRHKLCVSD